MTKLRIFVFLLTLTFVAVAGYFMLLIARGWRFDSKTLTLQAKGLFVVTSAPNAAQILIDGKLESATNATISLPPAEYDIELKKDGYLTWKKHITIKQEEVTKIDAYLFPAAPSLSSLTFTGATNPVLSNDRTKIAYGVPPSDKAEQDRVGIWIMELSDLPIGFSREPRRITDTDPANLNWQWSPDSRQLLIKNEKGVYVLDISSLTPSTNLVPLTDGKLTTTLTKWQQDIDKKKEENIKDLPPELAELLGDTPLSFSPDGNKVLYTLTKDINIPQNLIPSLPGSSTQKEERQAKKGNTYVYDLKEDKNFLVYSGTIQTDKDLIKEASASATVTTPISTQKRATVKASPTPTPSSASLRWFPTSDHLVLVENNKITIMDYDGTNAQTVYSGPYTFPYAVPFPNASRLLILTNLGSGETVIPNLYAVSLK